MNVKKPNIKNTSNKRGTKCFSINIYKVRAIKLNTYDLWLLKSHR